MKLFKIKIQDYIDENDNPIIKVEYVCAEDIKDVLNGVDGVIDAKQVLPFRVIEK